MCSASVSWFWSIVVWSLQTSLLHAELTLAEAQHASRTPLGQTVGLAGFYQEIVVGRTSTWIDSCHLG